ncbi:MAG TPA: GNAT family N-acetyltransferase [Candidatus Paceibacterota bacterium]|nr:GNAT family N-acetyltransferase [Candidatus Paceibacterota bacterium]
MKSRIISPHEYAQFDFLAAEYGTLFNTVGWTELYGDALVRLGIYEDGGELIGGFVLHQKSCCGFNLITNPPFTPSCGPFLNVKASHAVTILETRREAMTALIDYIKKLGFGLLFLKLDQSVKDALPFYWAGYRVIPSYTYILDLTASPDQTLANMSSVRRRNIQRAIKDGIEAREILDMHVVKQLVEGTFARQKKKIDRSVIDGILERYAKPENSYAFAAYQNDVPIATTFVVHDRSIAYYLLGGYDEDGKHHGAGALAMWQSILRAKQLGLKYFDFEGSVIPPIERYFRGFGGQLTPYFTVNKAWLPVEFVMKCFHRELF